MSLKYEIESNIAPLLKFRTTCTGEGPNCMQKKIIKHLLSLIEIQQWMKVMVSFEVTALKGFTISTRRNVHSYTSQRKLKMWKQLTVIEQDEINMTIKGWTELSLGAFWGRHSLSELGKWGNYSGRQWY